MPRTGCGWVLCLRGGDWAESLDQLGQRPHLSGASDRGRAVFQARVWRLDAAFDGLKPVWWFVLVFLVPWIGLPLLVVQLILHRQTPGAITGRHTSG